MEDGLNKLGFLARKQLGRGWYLTPEQIAEKNPQMTTDLLRMTGGLRVLTQGTGRFLVSNSSAGSSQDGCINVFIDHARFDQFQPGDVDDAAPTGDLGAIEYYSNASSVPSEFSVPGKACATLVIWTKTLIMTLKPCGCVLPLWRLGPFSPPPTGLKPPLAFRNLQPPSTHGSRGGGQSEAPK